MDILTAIFAGGCFWCMQPVFDSAPGVVSTQVGYSGGHTANPTYDKLHEEETGHYEAIEVKYNPSTIKYEELLSIYFANIDPFDEKGQFADKGHEYQTVVFYNNESEKKAAETKIIAVSAKHGGKKVATKVLPAKPFYSAEEYHQKYYLKNPLRYNAYKHGSGRADGLKKLNAK